MTGLSCHHHVLLGPYLLHLPIYLQNWARGAPMDHLDNKHILPCLHYLIAARLLLMIRVHYQELK